MYEELLYSSARSMKIWVQFYLIVRIFTCVVFPLALHLISLHRGVARNAKMRTIPASFAIRWYTRIKKAGNQGCCDN